MCFQACVLPLVYVCPTQMELPPLPLALRLWGDTHSSLCQAQMSIHSSTPLSLNPAQGSFAYWGRVCISVCVSVCVRVFVHQPDFPSQKRTGGPVDSPRMHCYYFIGDSAGLVCAKLVQLCAWCSVAPHEVMHALSLHFAVCTLWGLILFVWSRDSIKHTQTDRASNKYLSAVYSPPCSTWIFCVYSVLKEGAAIWWGRANK